jgi:hypothetical protein
MMYFLPSIMFIKLFYFVGEEWRKKLFKFDRLFMIFPIIMGILAIIFGLICFGTTGYNTVLRFMANATTSNSTDVPCQFF